MACLTYTLLSIPTPNFCAFWHCHRFNTCLCSDSSENLQKLIDVVHSLFLSNVNECVSSRESNEYVKGLNSKVKLELYKTFGKKVEFKRYLHGICDAGTRLLFKFRSRTHGLVEELGRHKGRNGMTGCTLCGDECESVVHGL